MLPAVAYHRWATAVKMLFLEENIVTDKIIKES